MEDPAERGLARGVRLGKYCLEERIGAGGMGEVWAAHDADLERRVALKVLRPGLAEDDDAQARLLREARAMARLRHPNVITVFDATTIDGRDLVAMELIDGENMASWLARGGHKPAAIVAALIAAGRGLAAAHAAGMIHRDFKPHNVLVERGGRVLVTDFGLARGIGDAPPLLARPDARAGNLAGPGPEATLEKGFTIDAAAGPADEPSSAASAETADERPARLRGDRPGPAPVDVTASAAAIGEAATAISPSDPPRRPSGSSSDRGGLHSPLTRTGTLLGTPAYMAPEQLDGLPADARADQFSFCVTAWEALAGRRPFSATTFAEMADAIARAAPEHADRIPRRLRALLQRGLSPDPRGRWPSIDALLDAIARAWRRPRRVAIATATTLTLAATVAVVTVASRGGETATKPTCPAGATAIATVWSPSIRADLGRRLGDAPAVAHALAQIDRWTQAWSASFDANCARTEDPDFLARRACLESQRDDFAMLLRSFDPASAARLVKTELARVLPASETCARAPRAIAPVLPVDPATRARTLELRAAIVELRTVAALGEGAYVERARRAAALVEQARDIGYPPLLAEALYARAVVRLLALPDGGLELEHALSDAFDTFGAAIDAAEAAGHDRVRVDALLGQLEAALDWPGRQGELDDLIRRADSAIQRLGDPGPELELDGLRADVAMGRGRWSEAIALAERTSRGWQERDAPESATRVGMFAAEARVARHDGDDLELAATLIEQRLAHRGVSGSRSQGELAWRRGKLDVARAAFAAAGVDSPLDGAGDPAGGRITGTIRGLGAGTAIDADADAARAARRSLPNVTITDSASDRSWVIPVGPDYAWRLNAVPPGRYRAIVNVGSAWGDVQTLRAPVVASAGASAKIELAYASPRPVRATWKPGTTGIAVALAGSSVPADGAALRDRFDQAAWSSYTNVVAPDLATGQRDWLAELSALGPPPFLVCIAPGAGLNWRPDGTHNTVEPIAPGPGDPAPTCVVVTTAGTDLVIVDVPSK